MNTDSIKFRVKGNNVTVSGYPELEGCEGTLEGDGMAFFFGDNRELYIANTQTGKIRKVSTGESLLVNDNEIDIRAIAKVCENGLHNAQSKAIRYAGVNRWDGFKNGMCAITWTLYPDGRYFADSDGFGMEDNDEEVPIILMHHHAHIHQERIRMRTQKSQRLDCVLLLTPKIYSIC